MPRSTMNTALFGAVLLQVLLGGCRENPKPEPQKDFVRFELPEPTRKAAPAMQRHLFSLIPFNTVRFQVKPDWVFLEDERQTQGPLNTLVTRMNLLHLSLFQGEHYVWGGSLLVGIGRGVTINSAHGYVLDLAPEGEDYRFVFRNGDTATADRFHNDKDYETWHEAGGMKLYLNYYVFPESLVYGPKRTPGQKRDP